MKIAVVDDEKNIRDVLRIALEEEGYETHSYPSCEKALTGITRNPVDVILLDIIMDKVGGMDGYEFLEKFRNLEKKDKKGQTPIIFLTSKDQTTDEVIGLKLGVEDYIKKPWNNRVLVERIKKVTKSNSIIEPKETRIEKGSLSLNESKHLCTWKGKKVVLTLTEFRLLEALARHPGMVRKRGQLIDFARGEDIYVEERTIDSHIKRIRKKFKKVDPEFCHIQTTYGLGYKFEIK